MLGSKVLFIEPEQEVVRGTHDGSIVEVQANELQQSAYYSLCSYLGAVNLSEETNGNAKGMGPNKVVENVVELYCFIFAKMGVCYLKIHKHYSSNVALGIVVLVHCLGSLKLCRLGKDEHDQSRQVDQRAPQAPPIDTIASP